MADPATIRIERQPSFSADAQRLLAEYYAAVNVVMRDDAEEMRRLLSDPRSGMWVAYQGDTPAGCVVLKAGVPADDAGECKRLYVGPAHRHQGVAEALMDTLEAAARAAGLYALYLDTNDGFIASVALYKRRGYQACLRYNDNPQATLFFRKALVQEAPR